MVLPLVEVTVYCQNFPYVSFMGQTLANHSYVDLGQVGTTDANSLMCHTDLATCCSSTQGPYRGDWFFPNGTRLSLSGVVYESRSPQLVQLRRMHSTSNGPWGIYRCNIPTVSVHDELATSSAELVYVGLYPANGGTYEDSPS